MTAALQFLGAARTVTGSKFLLYASGSEVLFDCGLFQGRKELRLRNWDNLPVDARKIDAVVLTHGHVDHIGYLPRLVKQGFRGPVYCTPATAALARVLLPDSAKLQEEEAFYANEKGYSNHHPALPLYDGEDADKALRRLETVDYGERFDAVKGVSCVFHPSGHILGSAFVEVSTEGRRTVLSGDLGGYDDPIMKPPAAMPPNVDYLVVESTYGGRLDDPPRPVREQMRDAVKPVLEAGGMVVIPAFAVGRTTLVLYYLRELENAGEIPDVPVYVDSPMAVDAVELYCRFGNLHNMRVDLLQDVKLCPLRTSDVHFIRTVEQSKRLNHERGPAIIVSSSGMATGGRVVHHLRQRLPDPKNLVLLVGYQAEGTRGRRLLEGERQVKIFGGWVDVRARVASIRGLSAHGDSDELMRWLKTASRKPKKTFLVHGEPESLAALGRRLDHELGFPHHAPDYLERVELE